MYSLSRAQDDAPPLPQTTAAPDVCVNPANQRIVDYLGFNYFFLAMRSNHYSNISKIAKREIEDRYYGRRHRVFNIQRAIK